MTNLRKLLINADDLGLSTAINAGILEAHLHGVVTSASIVASGEKFDEAIQFSRSNPSLGVGVHLTLVEENAVCSPSKLPHLAPHGVLPPSYGSLVAGVLTNRIPVREIELEFRAQIEKCLAAGLDITHLDSHQHTHALPPIFKSAARLAREYKIGAVRIPRSWPSLRDVRAHRFLPKCALSLLANFDAFLFCNEPTQATDYFAGLFESGSLSEPAILRIVSHLKPGVTELMCHPGRPDSNPRYANWNERRQTELAALTSASVRQAIQEHAVELINYRQLSNDPAKTAA